MLNVIEVKTYSKNRQPNANAGGLQIKDGGMSSNTRRTLAKHTEKISIPDGKNIKIVDTKTLKPHGGGKLGPYDKTSVTVNYQDNHVLAYVDPVTKTTISSTIFPQGTVKKSIPIPRS